MPQFIKRPSTGHSTTSAHNTQNRLKPLPAAVVLALSFCAGPVQAASIQVDTVSDTATGVCRLRDAIIAANTDTAVEGCSAGSGADIIRLYPVAGGTITLDGSRLPTITSDITIQGESVTIDGAGNSGLLNVSGSAANLTIRYLSMINGNAAGGDNNGAGILMQNGARLNVIGSTISGNTAAANGGGISLEGGGEQVELINSTVSGNVALGSEAGTGQGGGVHVASPTAAGTKLVLHNSTLSGNTATGSIGVGGALAVYDLCLYGDGVDVSLFNSTLFGNEARSRTGGLYTFIPCDRPNLYHSIISNNSVTDSPYTAPDCTGGLTISGTSFVGDPAGCAFFDGSVINGDPMLDLSLADNGGPTQTHMPLAASPVIDAFEGNCFFGFSVPAIGDPKVDITNDQRGFQRHDGSCDLGAVEFAAAGLQIGPDFVVDNSGDPSVTNAALTERFLTGDNHCNVPPGDCTLRDAVFAANQSDDASNISFSEELVTPLDIILAGVQPLSVISDLTIHGSGITVVGVDDVAKPWLERIFQVDSARMTLIGLGVSAGRAVVGGGGGIKVDAGATLELVSSTVSANRSESRGGGIFVGPDSTASLTNSVVSANGAYYNGGGIFVDAGGSLTIEGSTLASNAAGEQCARDISTFPDSPQVCGGGAVALDMATLLMHGSTLSGNSVRRASGAIIGNGAGIYASNNSDVSVSSSTLSSNLSEYGAGIWVSNSGLNVTNSTLSGNTAEFGGGLYALSASTADIISSTLSENTAGGDGGGILTNASTISITNSIVANSVVGPDCKEVGDDSLVSILGVSLIEDGASGCGLAPGPNLLAGDPGLGPLFDNGGITMTHRPAFDSSVINVGDNAFVPIGVNFDQRGPGFPRIIDTTIDLGSVEFKSLIFSSGFEEPR